MFSGGTEKQHRAVMGYFISKRFAIVTGNYALNQSLITENNILKISQ